MFESVYASATQAGAQPAPSMIPFFLMMAVLFGLLYFVTYRPRQKREKEHKLMVEKLAKSDEIVTFSGIMGKVVRIKDDYVVVAIAEPNVANQTISVEIKIRKNAIANVLPKGTLSAI